MYVVILGIKINSHESLYKSLTSIYGIGESQSYEICNFFGLSKFCTYFFITSKKKKKITCSFKKNYFWYTVIPKKNRVDKIFKRFKDV